MSHRTNFITANNFFRLRKDNNYRISVFLPTTNGDEATFPIIRICKNYFRARIAKDGNVIFQVVISSVGPFKAWFTIFRVNTYELKNGEVLQ